MGRKSSNISISKLARYAHKPSSVFDRVNLAATQYGTRAHNGLGKGPSVALLIISVIVATVAAALAGVI